MSDEARFLVLGGGPLSDFFHSPLSLAGTIVTFDGSQKPEDYDLFVLDGGSLSAEAFEKGASAARAALDANKPVLILTPTADQKDVLAAAGALRTYPNGSSIALLIEPHRDADDELRLWLAEQYAPDAGHGRLYRTAGGGGHHENAAVAASDVFEVQAPSLPSIPDIARFIERVYGAVTALKAGKLSALSSNGPSNPPEDIPRNLYDVTPVNFHYNIALGSSAVVLEGVAYIGVYYDNKSFNTPVQWLIIEHSGLFYTGGMAQNSSSQRGYSLGGLQIEGPNISSPTLTMKQSSPDNVNNVRTYTSTTSTTVEVATDPDGFSAKKTYKVDSSVTKDISDWRVLKLRPEFWQFAQQAPYDGASNPGASSTSNLPSGCVKDGYVAELPLISIGSLAFDTQTVWQHLPATNGKETITYKFHTQCNYTYATTPGKNWTAYFWTYLWDASREYTVDWSRAWPKR